MKLLPLTVGVMIIASPAKAYAESYCNENILTYTIADVPFGYAIVRMNYADLCVPNFLNPDEPLTCVSGARTPGSASTYQLTIERLDDAVVIVSPDRATVFTPCE